MTELFDQLYANGALLILWGALLFHLILPIPRSSHPITLWHKFAELLADKVNTQQSYQQSLISGNLALLLMLFPCLAVLFALKPLVWQPQLFELALLLLALDWRSNESLAKALIRAMANEDKPAARSLLAPYLNRETTTLSQLGIGKAAAETLIMGYGRNVIGVLFWFALSGGIGALMYRLTVELARAWSPSRANYAPFGVAAVRLAAVLDFIPLRLFALMILLGKHAGQTWQGIRQQAASWPLPGPAWLLCAVGNKLQLSLGGPAIYQGKRAERAKIGGRIAPSALHIDQLQHLLARRILIWILLQSLLFGLIYQGI
ncbi:cobalamin biosynthesis family protein [Vibrio vulnificus]|uniref:cobalamin biosynthesis family protein n=1 Tax=Vibrio vulnificus TaxID=672 RepID=UPI001A200074|nr:cobalamin biosynthesis family protein [Vibrio vulnificus]